jgi:hypothetical protein
MNEKRAEPPDALSVLGNEKNTIKQRNRSVPNPSVFSCQNNHTNQASSICVGESGFIREVGIRCLDAFLMVLFFFFPPSVLITTRYSLFKTLILMSVGTTLMKLTAPLFLVPIGFPGEVERLSAGGFGLCLVA